MRCVEGQQGVYPFVNEELAMTVHARQLARLCRERLAAQEELPVLRQQPQQQQAAVETHTTAPAKDAGQPAR
jgi:hypothetical protein